MRNPSAGSGEPYWYEWTVGLLKIVEMLHRDSDIESVTLQAHGSKGWDDVVVKRTKGKRDYYQVKHSRKGVPLTFGSLVSGDSDSLLANLFASFKELHLDPKRDRCFLFTNREAGERPISSERGVRRPPLPEFLAWLKGAVRTRASFAEIAPQPEWADAWQEWISQLDEGSEAEALGFLSAFDVETSQEGLDALADRVLRELAEIFGVSEAKAQPLLHGLDHALRRWTVSGEAVNPEVVMDALALEDATEGEFRAPPPPSPFFPTRQPFVEMLERSLIDTKGPPVLFLSAEPGAGKTSALSELANRRSDNALRGVVGIRYFAFRPLTPESPVIPGDADRFVRPDALWFDLLRQLRRGLRGRLRLYNVPVRDELIDWPQARNHVLRLASRIGTELKRPFVIAIDGIYHAARAQLTDPVVSREFFASLPAPEEIAQSGIRLLLAGQPASDYPQYPVWLRTPPASVRQLSFGPLEIVDIEVLLRNSAPRFPESHRDAATRVILEVTRGNTLGVVFACAEAANCDNAESLRDRLLTRELQSGITAYYRNIWEHCVAGVSLEVATVLAGAIALARERITGAFLESAFSGLGQHAQNWNLLLGRLGPLLVEEGGGYRIRHNDLRVFLQGHLNALPAAQRREVASGFVDHYKRPTANRRITHESLLPLLRQSGRENEWPQLFDVAWVMEAAGLGLSYVEIEDQCIAALQIASALNDWEVIADVACACETLERWRERCEFEQPAALIQEQPQSPAFLRTELFVRPLSEWQSSDLERVANDGQELWRAGERPRAVGLLKRWLVDLDVAKICDHLTDKSDTAPSFGNDRSQLSQEAVDAFEQLGRTSRLVEVVVSLGNFQRGMSAQAASSFEKAWFDESCNVGPFTSLKDCFLGQRPRFYDTIVETASTLATRQQWALLKQLLVVESANREELVAHRPLFAFRAAWWSLRSGADAESKDWVAQVDTRPPKFEGEHQLTSALVCARIRGWSDPAVEIATIGDEMLQRLTLPETRTKHAGYYGLWLRAAATIGRLEGVLFRSGSAAASEVIRPRELQQLASALWDHNQRPIAIHSDWGIAGNLASELVDTAIKLDDSHKDALVSAASEPLKDWPVDDRRPSIWSLLLKTGHIEKLREWLNQWVGRSGRAFFDSPNEREYLVDGWESFAANIGANEVIGDARRKLASGRIGYRSDRDETFFASSVLLDAYLCEKPDAWSGTGVQLWSLSDAASGYGCGNNYDSDITTALAKAAFRAGPADIVRLVMAEEPNRSDLYWLHTVRNYLIDGVRAILNEGDHVASDTKLSWWCLAIGFCRWFQNGDVHRLAELRIRLIETCEGKDATDLPYRLRQLSPSEAVRNPRPPSTPEPKPVKSDADAQPPTYGDSIRIIQNGGSCLLPRALELVRETLTDHASTSDSLIPQILRSIGYHEYAYHWRSEGGLTTDSICELARLLSDRQLWPLMENAIAGIQKGWHWLQPVSDNIQLLCIARARARGEEVIKSSLERQMSMHNRWIRGLSDHFDYAPVTLPPEESADTWHNAIAKIFSYLLTSRTGEVVASAVHGIHCLAAHHPEIIKTLFALTANDEWKARWILNAAERWAFLEPAAIKEADQYITAWFEKGPLEHRLQAWLIKAALCFKTERPLPSLPWPSTVSRSVNTLITKQREALELPPVTFGLMHVSDRHRAATQHLACLEAAVGELNGVRHRTAELLDDLPERDRSRPWPESMRQHGDTNVGLVDVGRLIGRAIEERMPAPPPAIVARLAQGFLPNEDPWVLRHSPFPDDDLSAWPDEDEIGGWRKPPDVSVLRRRLLLLACEHTIEPDETVLAAHAEVYSSFYDVHFNVWWQQDLGDESEIRTSRVPTTISGRSFTWWLGNWWQPSLDETNNPLTFMPGGFQRLAHCFVDWFPARLWAGALNWAPSGDDPLIWTMAGKPVARYQRLHGRIRESNNYHHRQPTLTRWLVKRSAFEMISEKLGRLHRCDDLAHAPSPER